MPSPLQQLENNEAVLLMYAADELPPEDRAEVEQMLAIDGGMRAELESVRASQAAFENAMGDLDAITRLPMSTAVALRKLGPALVDWQQHRLAPPSPAAPVRTARYAWWVYPVAAAAAVLLVAVGWWGFRGDDGNTGSSVAVQSDSVPAAPDQFANGDGRMMRGPGDSPFFRGPGGSGMVQMDSNDPEMIDAEQQVATLTHRSDDAASTSSIFMTDTQND